MNKKLTYNKNSIKSTIDNLQYIVDKNDEDAALCYSKCTIQDFKAAVHFLKLSDVYVNRINLLLSGEDSERCFHEHLLEDMRKVFGEEEPVKQIELIETKE